MYTRINAVSMGTSGSTPSFTAAIAASSAWVTAAAAPTNVFPSHLKPDNAPKSPTGVIDLRDSPSKRWDSVIDGVIARHTFEHSFGPWFAHIDTGVKAEGLKPLVDFLDGITQKRFPVFYEEAAGIVAKLNSLGYNETNGHVSMTNVIALQYVSEVSHLNVSSSSPLKTLVNPRACTSLVARKPNGDLLHVRNDDAGAHHALTNLTVDVTFVDGSGVVAKAVAFVSIVGTYTVVRPSIASLTEDERILLNDTKLTVAQFMQMLTDDQTMGPSAFIMRQALVDSGGGPAGTTRRP